MSRFLLSPMVLIRSTTPIQLEQAILKNPVKEKEEKARRPVTVLNSLLSGQMETTKPLRILWTSPRHS